ncbi:MAG: GNAT family protein [Aestuariivita sp.]|nr:GNAT family protein [Aestuariivita sp.]
MVLSRRKLSIETERLLLRPPKHSDYRSWITLRGSSRDFLIGWEPAWSADHLSRKTYYNRLYWANRAISNGSAFPFFIFQREDRELIGAITIESIRRGPSQSGTLGYWIGEQYTRQGFMKEALFTVVHFAFSVLDLSRMEAACLPENKASRALLESVGFKYEGVGQSYLQIAGRWRTHVLYSTLRSDRRGTTNTG